MTERTFPDGQPLDNSHVKYQYTISPSDVEMAENLQADWWKGEGPPNQLPTLVGFQEVGVRSAYTKGLYYHDTLVLNWLKSFELLSADEREVIPVKNVIFGTPERLFAIDKEKGKGSMTGRVILPAINVSRTETLKVYDRGPVQRTARRQLMSTDGQFKNYVEIKSAYHMVDLTYQIDLWTKYQSEMQMLQEQILLPFLPNAYFRLLIPEYYFDEIIMVRLGGMSNTSSLEPDRERLIRTTVTLTVQGYIPVNVSKVVRTIKDLALYEVEMSVPEPEQTYVQEEPASEWTIALKVIGEEPHVVVFDDANNHVVDISLTWDADASPDPLVHVSFNDGVPRAGVAHVFSGSESGYLYGG